MKHPHHILVSWAIIAAVSLCHTTPAAAQDKFFKFEITPFAAYRIGGQFDENIGNGQLELNDSAAQGIMLDVRVNHNGQWELLYAHQETEVDTQGIFVNDPQFDLDVEYFHLGGTYLFDGDTTRPFMVVTLGLSHFDPQLAGLDSENYFSMSIGGGLHLNAGKRFGVRLEGRLFTTFVDTDSNIFCSSVGGAGTCLIQVDGSTVTQWEARVGLVFRF